MSEGWRVFWTVGRAVGGPVRTARVIKLRFQTIGIAACSIARREEMRIVWPIMLLLRMIAFVSRVRWKVTLLMPRVATVVFTVLARVL